MRMMRQRMTVLLGFLAVALLAGCSAPIVRSAPLQHADALWSAPLPMALGKHAPQLAPPDLTPREALWTRVRSGLQMPGCDYHPQVDFWAKRFTARPAQFAGSLRKAMPFLLLVMDELERRQLPAELLLLPYIESHYRPVASSGNRPAGIWQLMPATARMHGLTVNDDYDGRLDAVASTTAALDLLERLERQFGDWRLVNMAFNAGEFRVKGALPDAAETLSARELARINVTPTTHEHLFKLLGAACVIRDPARFAVRLPEPRRSDQLRAVQLEQEMDLRLAAHLAGMDVADLRYFNAGYRSPSARARQLLLPLPRLAAFESAAAQLPTQLWHDAGAVLGMPTAPTVEGGTSRQFASAATPDRTPQKTRGISP